MKESPLPSDGLSNSCLTTGELFAGGNAIELLSGEAAAPQLLLRQKGKSKVAPEIRYKKKIYRPRPLPASFAKALLLPGGIARATIRQIFEEILRTLKQLCALPEGAAESVAGWLIATWFADCLFAPPPSAFTGRIFIGPCSCSLCCVQFAATA